MQKPNELIQLLAELESMKTKSSVETGKKSKAVIRQNDDSDDDLTLTGAECKLLLHSEEAVNQMFEAIGSPEEANIELYGLIFNDDSVLDALDQNFSTVDEM